MYACHYADNIPDMFVQKHNNVIFAILPFFAYLKHQHSLHLYNKLFKLAFTLIDNQLCKVFAFMDIICNNASNQVGSSPFHHVD